MEAAFIDQLRRFATHPAARGLNDDAAVLMLGSTQLVLTHDMLVEGVHFLPSDPPETVAWKLLAVNLSDLAAKGAKPLGALLGFTLSDADWDQRFAQGLSRACAHFACPLLGGDSVSVPIASSRVFALTALGEASGPVPTRAGAVPGDTLYVTGTIGDAGVGLKMAQGDGVPIASLLSAYQQPVPQGVAGLALAPIVTAMMDVSDGLLIDAQRLAEASGCAISLNLDAVPLSPALAARNGTARDARLDAATAGDDYQLLFTANLPLPPLTCRVSEIGIVSAGRGLTLFDKDGAVPLPMRLGWLHGAM
jgi:thiamine-monophosphate kinase